MNMERSHRGLVHRLGKAAYRKVSRVRIPPSPPRQFIIGMTRVILSKTGDRF